MVECAQTIMQINDENILSNTLVKVVSIPSNTSASLQLTNPWFTSSVSCIENEIYDIINPLNESEYITVQCTNINLAASSFPAYVNVKICYTPPVETPVLPLLVPYNCLPVEGGYVDIGTVNFSWSPVLGAVRYAIRINNINTPWCTPDEECYNPAYPNCTKYEGDYCEDNVIGTSFSHSLSVGTYDWWIHAMDSDGRWGDAEAIRFTVVSEELPPVEPIDEEPKEEPEEDDITKIYGLLAGIGLGAILLFKK